MISKEKSGAYLLRMMPCPALPEIEGQVVYLRDVQSDGFTISLMDNCRPMDGVYQLPIELDDNGWYDVSSLIMEANGVIMPKYGRCVFASEAAVEYRNYIDPNIALSARLDETQIQERLCILGRTTPAGIEFTRTAYYIVSRDSNGYIIGYSGFCQPVQLFDRPQITQRILRLSGTGRSFFDAEMIVNACNAAFEEDQRKAQVLAKRARDLALAEETSNEVRTSAYGHHLEEMKLH